MRRWAAALALYVGIFAFAFIALAMRGAYVGDAVDQLIEQLPHFFGPQRTWEPDTMLGYPQSADPNAAFWYPLAALARLTHAGPNALEFAAYVIAACGAFGLVRSLTRSTPAALAGGLIVSLDGFMIGHAGHASIVQPAAWAPYVFWSLAEQRNSPQRGWIAIGAAAFALTLLAGQPQVATYVLFAAAAYAIASARVTARGIWPYTTGAALTLVLGLGLAAIMLLPTAELAAASTRADYTFEQFQEFTVPVLQLPIRLFLPYALGTTQVPPYAFSAINVGSFAEMSNYVGIVTILLATAGMMGAPRNTDVRFWSALALIAILASTNNQLGLAWVTYHIPLYDRFRAPGRDALELGLAAAVLCGFGITGIASGAIGPALVIRAMRRTAIAFALALIVYVVLARLPPEPQFYAMFGNANLNVNPLQNAALAIPFALLVIACVVVRWWSIAPQHPVRTTALIVVFAVDLCSFGACGYWNYDAFSVARIDAPPLAAALRTALASEHQRLVTLPGNGAVDAGIAPNLNVLWGVPSLRGYAPLELARTAALFDFDGSESLARLAAARDRTLDLAGVRFVLVPDDIATSPASPWHPAALVRAQPNRWRVVSATDRMTVLENRDALPRAWIARHAKRATPAAAFAAIRGGTIDPQADVFLDRDLAAGVAGASGTATIDALDAGEMRLHVTCNMACILVTSDAPYPGWHAFVDGRDTTIAVADGALRAIAVPSGNHAVVFRYVSQTLIAGAIVSAMSAMALAIIGIWKVR